MDNYNTELENNNSEDESNNKIGGFYRGFFLHGQNKGSYTMGLEQYETKIRKRILQLGFVRKVGSQATADARHAYHRLKATCQLFIACGDAATFFKPTKAAFYRIPLPIFGFVEPPG